MILYDIVTMVLTLLVGALVAVGNGNAIVRGCERGESFFNPVWNNTMKKLSALFIIILGAFSLPDVDAPGELILPLLGCGFLAGLFGAVIGVVCAGAGSLGARVSVRFSVVAATLALFLQLIVIVSVAQAGASAGPPLVV